MDAMKDEKYIVLRRDRLPTGALAVLGTEGYEDKTNIVMSDAIVHDAVVIRRQDFFAAPALNSYAHCIAISARLVDDKVRQGELIAIADYFHQQAELAAEEGWKFPD